MISTLSADDAKWHQVLEETNRNLERQKHGQPQAGPQLPAASATVENKNPEASERADSSGFSGRRVVAVRADQVVKVKPEFLKDGWYPCGVVTVIAGEAGIGKSSITLRDAADATRGRLSSNRRPVTVAIAAGEDDQGMQRMRLEAAGADLARVCFLSMGYGAGSDMITGPLELPRDIYEVEQFLKAQDVGMLIVDPLAQVLKGDINRETDVRAALDPLTLLARHCRIPVIVVAHFNKGKGGRGRDKLSGSHAIRDAARSVLLAVVDEDSGDVIVQQDKANYSVAGKSWAYRMESASVEDSEGQAVNVPKAVPLGESDLNINDLLNSDVKDGGEVKRFIMDTLKAAGGTLPAGEVISKGEAQGLNGKTIIQTRYRHNDEIDVVTYQGRKLWSINGGKNADASRGQAMAADLQASTCVDHVDLVDLVDPVDQAIEEETDNQDTLFTDAEYGPIVHKGYVTRPQNAEQWVRWSRDGCPELQPTAA